MDFIKDADCTKETPVRLGVPDAPIYGKGIKLKPRVDGRTDSEHFKKIYLPELLPLEEYDLIVVLISGGKDSVACYLKLLELGVPKERIEFWHHDIDGGHPSRRIDDYSVWIAENITPVTEAGTDEQPGFTGYEYDLTQYTKDEYIKMIDDRNASLEDQMTQAQEAMCEIYEMMA